MALIVPAILPASREDLEHKLLQLYGITDEVQIDSVDGKSSATATWPYDTYHHSFDSLAFSDEAIRGLESFRFEMDLMVEDAPSAIREWMNIGASRIVVHAERVRELPTLIQDFQTTYGHDKGFAPDLIAFGLALTIDSDVALIEPYLDHCDFIQFMGIATIGKQGQPFDTRVVPKIAAFHRAHPDMAIQVDGGVSTETIPDLMNAGASRLIVGSALWTAPNIGERMQALTELAHTYGY